MRRNQQLKSVETNNGNGAEQSAPPPRIPWNKGRNKITDPRIAASSQKLIGKPSGMKDKRAWNRGLTKNDHHAIASMADKQKMKVGLKNGFFGRTHSEETKRKIGKKNSHPQSKEFCEKLRLIGKRNMHGMSIGKNEKQIIDALEMTYGVTIQRQHRVLDWIVDGYEPTSNTVVEIYETGHLRSLKKDLFRQHCIQNHLHCKFLTIWDIPDARFAYID
jgi:hypothetical protein